MSSNDLPNPRKLSEAQRKTNDATTLQQELSSSNYDPSFRTSLEPSALSIDLRERPSQNFTSNSPKRENEESHHSTRRNQQQEVQEEEEKTYPPSQGSEHKARTNTINSEILNSQEFFSMAENDPDKQHHKDDWGQCDIEAHRVYGKYLEEYQKKFPSEIQHLRVSKQSSSSESKKSERMAFRRINNNLLGETLVSEFVQDALADKESNSKSSKGSSHENLINLENNESPLPEIRAQQTRRQEIPDVPFRVTRPHGDIREIDPSIEASDEDMLKNSDLQALLRKKTQQIQAPVRFNVMIAGEAGLGKSTFIDCFLGTKYDVTTPIRPSTREIQEHEGTPYRIRQYNGMTFRIVLIDGPGYSTSKNISKWYNFIKGHITKQFMTYKEEKHAREKQRKITKEQEDKRIHMMLYFLSGPRIKKADIECMKKFSKYCSVIPILAKGDSYTAGEVRELKNDLIQRAFDLKLDWFDFAEALKDSPEKLKELTESAFGPCPPFLIISSVSKIQLGPNNFIYGREYTWGTCNIENPKHSDFKLLQTLLGGYICLEAIQVTKSCYKQFFKRLEEKKKYEEEEEKKKNFGLSAVVAVGVFGAFMILKKK